MQRTHRVFIGYKISPGCLALFSQLSSIATNRARYAADTAVRFAQHLARKQGEICGGHRRACRPTPCPHIPPLSWNYILRRYWPPTA